MIVYIEIYNFNIINEKYIFLERLLIQEATHTIT